MTITQTFCSASLLALAAIMGPVAPGYAGEPCCDWVYGKYINLKTGREVKPPKGAVARGGCCNFLPHRKTTPRKNSQSKRQQLSMPSGEVGSIYSFHRTSSRAVQMLRAVSILKP